MEELLERHWHHLEAEEVLELMESSAGEGLDRFEIQHRQELFGPNRITMDQGHGPLVRFLLQFNQPLVYILIAAGLITGFIAEWVDAGVILAVVLVNAVIGYVQESKAVGAIAALARTVTTRATVIRSGEKTVIPSNELVPGDVVLVASGDKVPADMRLLRSRELRIDESALTGESLPVEKTPAVLVPDTALADRKNMAYASTMVTYGQGTGVVVATANHTEVGRISTLLSRVKALETPLTRKITGFSGILLWAILGLGAVTFLAGILRGRSVVEMFMATVALTVGAIPEGLPAAVTIILAIGVSRMAERRAIIRKLPAVETLGSTTVICSDKTGTLTQNQMTVRTVFAGGETFLVSGSGYDPAGAVEPEARPGESPNSLALFDCLRAGLLCNDSQLFREGSQWTIQGDPTEGALIVAAGKAGLCHAEENMLLPRADTLPFESEYQYMATLHGSRDGNRRVVYLKGSVEQVLARCTLRMGAEGERLTLTAEAVVREAEKMALEGQRVLAFARREEGPDRTGIDHADLSSGFVFLGLQGMIDPPREEAAAAVTACRRAGISVKMITGDHAMTAAAVARQLGILDRPTEGRASPLVLNGRQIEELDDTQLMDAAQRSGVFARVAPEQKLRLVEALQTRGEVVAMTGDGVNDAPALKQADIGIAMGREGTEVAREAADMILTDDNFASIEAAVEEGRGVFDNLIKFIVWALPTNLGQGLVIITAVFSGAVLPILPVQSLWINMTTAGALGLMLAFEPKEKGLMQKLPRDQRSPLLSRELVIRILLVGFLLLVSVFGLFEWEEWRGAGHAEARTVAVNVFAAVSLAYLLNCRSLRHPLHRVGLFSNGWILIGSGFIILLQALLTYAPFMNRLFHTAPIRPEAWLYILGSAAASYFIVELEKRQAGGKSPQTIVSAGIRQGSPAEIDP